MVSRDYTQEVGLSTGQKTVSKPVAAIVIAVLLAAGWFAVQALIHASPHAEHPPHATTP